MLIVLMTLCLTESITGYIRRDILTLCQRQLKCHTLLSFSFTNIHLWINRWQDVLLRDRLIACPLSPAYIFLLKPGTSHFLSNRMSHVRSDTFFLPSVKSNTYWRSCGLTVIINAQGDEQSLWLFPKKWSSEIVMQKRGTNYLAASLEEGYRLLLPCHFVVLCKLQINVSNSSWFFSSEHRDLIRFAYWCNYSF